MFRNNSDDLVIRKPLLGFPLIFQSDYLEKICVAVMDRLHRGRLTVNFPSGNAYALSGNRDEIDGQKFHAVWNLHSYRPVRRMLRSQSVGFAEAYMEGEWDSPDLTHLLELMACNMDAMEAAVENWTIVKAWNRVQHFFRANTKRGSRKNIAYHYDLGNDFYRVWLDSSMTYSAALFDDQHQDLASAQENKYRQLAQDLDLQQHHHVLEIGCGWGGFAEFAARTYGCKVTCLTLSREQLSWARLRIEKAGLAHLVEFRYQDYRDVRGEFDRIVSIEMFEAVGEEHWSIYFRQLQDRLKPGGKAGLQIISIANERYTAYRGTPDFIQKYIFPGGMLPSEEKLYEHFTAAGLRRISQRNFGLSYAETLELWRKQFISKWHEIAALGYTEKFRRMWEYYLCYCEAGFRRGTIDVGHYLIEKPETDQA